MNDCFVGKTLVALAAFLLLEPPGAKLPASERSGAPEPSIATITDAWARRQAALKTLRMTWHTEHTAVGFYAMIQTLNSPKPARHRGARPAKKAPSGPKSLTITLHSKSVLCLADDRLAYTSDTEGIDRICAPEADFGMPSHVQMILSGGSLRKYSDSRTSPMVADANTAAITSRSGRNCFEMGLPEIKPLALALRPLTSTLGSIDLSKYTISPIHGRIGADTCLILEPGVDAQSSNADPRASFWVDPARDYAIVRAVVDSKGRCQRLIDITYDREPGGNWLPTIWSAVLITPNGNLDQQFRSTRDAVSVGGSLPPSTFDFDRADSLLAEHNRTIANQARLARSDMTKARSQRRPGPSFVVVTNAVLAVLITGGYLAHKYKGMLVK